MVCDKLVFAASMKELISSGHLLQPEYYAAYSPDISEVGVVAGEYNQKQMASVYTKEVTGCMIENWFEIAPMTSTVAFTASRANAADAVSQFRDRGVTAEYLDCKTSTEDRERIIAATEAGDNKILVNVGIIGIGSDVPCLETVILNYATMSVQKYMQNVGRGSRPYGTQTHFNVIDHGNHVRRLGRVENITEDYWSLEEKFNANKEAVKKNKVNEKAKPEIKCSKCMHLFKGAATCPKCGQKIAAAKVKGEAGEFVPGALQKVGSDGKDTASVKRNKSDSVEVKVDFFSEVLTYVKRAGKKEGYAAVIYKDRYGVWPNAIKGKAYERNPCAETMSFVKHAQIKMARA